MRASADDTVGNWYGGFVASISSNKDSCILAYDDGDMHRLPRAEFLGLIEMQNLVG